MINAKTKPVGSKTTISAQINAIITNTFSRTLSFSREMRSKINVDNNIKNECGVARADTYATGGNITKPSNIKDAETLSFDQAMAMNEIEQILPKAQKIEK
jgi:hypothetical protein